MTDFSTAKAAVERLVGEEQHREAVSLARDIFHNGERLPIRRRTLLLAQTLEQTGNQTEAIAFLKSRDLPPPQQMYLAELLLRTGRSDEAAAALPDETADGDPTDNANIIFRLRRASVLLRTGDIARARTILRETTAIPDGDLPPATCLRIAILSNQAKLPETAIDAACRVIRSERADAPQAQKATAILLSPHCDQASTGLPTDILDALETHLATTPDQLRLRIALGDLLIRMDQADRARKVLTAPISAPAPAQELISLMRLQMTISAYQQVIDTAQNLLSDGLDRPEQEAPVALILARSLTLAGQPEEAISVLEKAVSRHSDDNLWQLLSLLLRKSGKSEDLANVSTNFIRNKADQLPASLAQGLADIPEKRGPDLLNAPLSMWVPWQLSGLREAEWPEWSKKLLWGQSAARLLQIWGLYGGPKRRKELLDLIDPINLSPLRAAMANGKGAILVGTHMGPRAASFFACEDLEWPFSYLGRGGNTALTRSSGIYVAELGVKESINSMLRHLAGSGVLGVTADGYIAGGARNIHIGGSNVKLSRLAPRLSFLGKVPSFWLQAEWISSRLRVSIEPLPIPDTGEDRRTWEDRWFAAFTEKLLRYMAGAPENLSGFNGLWHSLRERERDLLHKLVS